MLMAVALAAAPAAVTATDISGIWWTPERDGKIAIAVDTSGHVGGRLIAVAPEDADARDEHNPDPRLRGRRVLGLPILDGFAPDGPGKWAGGTIYDPDSGDTYRGTLTLDDRGRLVLRGTVLFGLFGRTEILAHVAGPSPATRQPGEPALVYLPQ